MPSRTPSSCPHELRPGTTVCLHCRRAARATGNARARRTALHIGLAGAVVVICAAGASTGLNALQRNRAGAAPDRARDSAPAAPPDVATSAAAPAERANAATLPGTLPLAPVTREGRTPLRHRPAFAVRAGDVVTVHFDATMTRTRRADKFEKIVRATLPELYGAPADSILAAVRTGALVGVGALTTELPVRGIRLPHPRAGALTLWPETRPGRDGPLVVAYRVTATP